MPNLTIKIFAKSKKNKQKTNEESLFLHRDLKSILFEGFSMKETNQHNTAALKKLYQNRATTSIEIAIYIRKHSFFRRGDGPEEFWGGSLTFCLPEKRGSA